MIMKGIRVPQKVVFCMFKNCFGAPLRVGSNLGLWLVLQLFFSVAASTTKRNKTKRRHQDMIHLVVVSMQDLCWLSQQLLHWSLEPKSRKVHRFCSDRKLDLQRLNVLSIEKCFAVYFSPATEFALNSKCLDSKECRISEEEGFRAKPAPFHFLEQTCGVFRQTHDIWWGIDMAEAISPALWNISTLRPGILGVSLPKEREPRKAGDQDNGQAQRCDSCRVQHFFRLCRADMIEVERNEKGVSLMSRMSTVVWKQPVYISYRIALGN